MAEETQTFNWTGSQSKIATCTAAVKADGSQAKDLEDIENLLSSSIGTSINAMRSLSDEYETSLHTLQKDIISQWKVCIQCLDKLTEAAVETRDELIEKKESQMKNIHALASVLNGMSQANPSET
ncbi:uncharacterized protein [Watersipora subatra]|uniref:uncharacterized protein n=1 Tax=Watersipora subatra TaxID=2589382 RepID=UPI00355C6487